ncbi:MAG: hypothetical protein WBM13_05500 [Bacteroidia bacterium]
MQINFRMYSFAIAVFIVFGTTLFSCSTSKNTGEQIICNDTLITKDKVSDIEYTIMGEIAPVQNQDSIPVESEPKEYKMGKIKRE